MTEGITKLISQIPNAAASIPKVLSENNPIIMILALALTGNSVNPMVGNIAMTK